MTMSASGDGQSEPYRIDLRPLMDVALITDFVDLDPQTFANPRWNTQRCRDRYGRDDDGIAGVRSGVTFIRRRSCPYWVSASRPGEEVLPLASA